MGPGGAASSASRIRRCTNASRIVSGEPGSSYSRCHSCQSRSDNSVRRDDGLVARGRADARRGGVRLRPGRHVTSGCGQPEDGHVAVDGLVLAGVDAVRLVPDADVARVANGPIEATPGLEVGQIRVAGEAVERLEVTP